MGRNHHIGTTPGDYQTRLEAASSAVSAWLDGYEDEVETRDAIILEAIDAGTRRADVARWAGLSPVRVTQVVARRAAER